ncbi:MAG: hypothetical protein NZ893_01545 [Candidatus Aenigmarchaeota archaeon]|nr:hypothetical protein [Candidatus Aenigmarchaeota archaeon]
MKVVDGEKEAEFSPWAYEFKRIALICDRIADYSKLVRDGHLEYLESLVNVIEELYDWIRSLIFESERKKIEEKLKEAKTIVKTYKNLQLIGNINVENLKDKIEKIFELKRDLLDLKQRLGLGIPVKEKLGLDEKLDKVLGL